MTEASYEAFRHALRDTALPALFVDTGAFDRNVDRIAARARRGGVSVRVATKSLRVPQLIRRALDRGAGALAGLLTYAAREAELLAELGFDDLLVAYPAWQDADLEALVRITRAGKRVRVAVDDPRAVDRIGAFARSRGVTLGVVLCIDMSLEAAGGRLHLGVRRSPLHDVEHVVALARYALRVDGVEVGGLLAYEAQIAGLTDDAPGRRAMGAATRVFKRLSALEVSARRGAMVRALTAEGVPLALVNGGGTGSLDTTTRASSVTEVTVGSGFFKPHLFDRYRASSVRELEPSCFFALEVTRQPGPSFVTCLGGGYVASGPPGRDRVPLPWLPEGLTLLDDEMAGEVQTPLRLPSGVRLPLGAPVVFRHAKAGEVCERFDEAWLLRDGEVEGRAPTYRGMGRCFF